MRLTRTTILGALLLMLAPAPLAVGQRADRASQMIARRATVAIKYPEREGTSVDIVGTALNPRVSGKADVKRTAGRTRVKLAISNLEHPQSLGGYYTTYVVGCCPGRPSR